MTAPSLSLPPFECEATLLPKPANLSNLFGGLAAYPEKLKALAVEMGKAQSLKDQAALQQLIAALINYVPGFNEYGKYNIPGINFYQPEAIYQDKKVPENQRGLLNGLASELLHKKMVDMQYEGME